MKARYEKLAQQSYANSQSLLTEAIHILGEKSPRSLALAVIAAEEFGKAYLCKGYSCGAVSHSKVKNAFKSHPTKGVAYIRLIVAALLYHKFVYPRILERQRLGDRLLMTAEEETIDFREGLPFTVLLIKAWGRKNKALYVENSVMANEPTDAVSLDETELFISLLATFTNGFEVILQQSDQAFMFTFERTNRISRAFSRFLKANLPRSAKMKLTIQRAPAQSGNGQGSVAEHLRAVNREESSDA